MSRHRASSMINMYGLNYCADHTNGNIYEYSLDIYDDNGDPIIKERDTAVIHGGLFGVPGKKLYFDEVEFIIVAGQTAVEGTGLGPQPVITTPPTPLTNCNEVWEYGVLTPDLHVSGVSAGTWEKDVIIGTGDVRNDNLYDGVWMPDIGGDFEYFSGDTPGANSGLPQYYYDGCQWYAYCGPDLVNNISVSTYSGFTAVGTLAEDNSEAGIGGTAGASAILTDNDASAAAYGYKTSALSTVDNDSGRDIVARYVFEKDLTATHWSLLQFVAGTGGGQVTAYVTFNQATGAVGTPFGSAANKVAEAYSNGDYWVCHLQMDSPLSSADPNAGAIIGVSPAYNTDGSITEDVSLTGKSIKIVDSAVYSSLSKDIPLGFVRRSGLVTNIGGYGSKLLDQSVVYVDAANHDNTEGGYYIEWRPQYIASELTHDVEILSLNDSYGLLYYDISEAKLVATDGANTASVDLTIVADTKYRLGVAWGDKLRVGVDGTWSAESDYDGGFTTGGNLSIFRNSEAVNLWRELRGFYVPYLDAYNEVSTLMAGGGTGYTILPGAPDPDPQTELVAPFWSNTGNWIDISALTTTTFATMFGYTVEGSDFNSVFTVNKAALVNTSDAGNKLQIQDSGDCTNAYLAICDVSGNIVDSMVYSGVPNGDSVTIPTGANYYVVITSDTGSAKIKKWDSSTVSVAGAVSWESFFGTPFSTTRALYDVEKVIPDSGIAIYFTVPNITAAYALTFKTIETTGAPDTTRTGSVNQTVGDYTSDPTYTWGIGGTIDCGINFTSGVDKVLIPGETYIFNVRNDTPATNNWIRVQARLIAQ